MNKFFRPNSAYDLLIDNTKLNPNLFYFNPNDKKDLIIIDDFLPNLLGSWRAIEIGTYLQHYKNANLLCTVVSYIKYKTGSQFDFELDKNLFLAKYNLQERNQNIIALDGKSKVNINAKHAYCLFYNNIKTFLPIFQKYNIPFSFTLYPGGGFRFFDSEVDSFLQNINESELFKGIIVTQKSVHDYLIERNLISEDKIKFIYGAAYDTKLFEFNSTKKYYKKNKTTLDICFVAGKYSEKGIDKGFDVFSQIAYTLSSKYDFVNFHVVGGFSNSDLLYNIDSSKIKFIPYQQFNFFPDFFNEMDIILSPVKPNVLGIGSFDGFPTAAVLDAALCQVLVITSDPLGDNIYPKFKNGSEIFIANSNRNEIVTIIENLIQNPLIIESVSIAGRKKALNLLSQKNQLNPRVEFLKCCIDGN